MRFPSDVAEVFSLTLDMEHIKIPADPKMWGTFTQELSEILEDSFPGELLSASCDLGAQQILLVFKSRLAAETFKHDWYMVRAKMLARVARGLFTVDPDDIPF